MAISLRDLDLRGGELLGEAQADHARLIGIGLYQDMLAAAVRAAKDEPGEPEAAALQGDALHAGAGGFVPADYAPQPAARVNLYHRLAKARDAGEVDRLADEMADRFGAIPEAAEGLFAAARIRALARALGVTRVAAGPNGVALSFRPGTMVEAEFADVFARFGDALDWNGERLLHRQTAETPEARRAAALDLLQELA